MRKLFIIVLAGCFLITGIVSNAFAAEKKKIELVYVEWSCATATANVTKAVLQEKLGYDVEITPVSAAAMWQAIGTGDVDGMTCAWLPITHGHYLEKVKDKVVNLGPNLKGAGVGLVVPKYVTIDSIDQLNEHADKFDGKIIGIDPGAGIMSTTEKALKAYKLDKFKLMEGSGATMCAELGNRIKSKQWVVVTGWTPHWKFARWELKYLKDPKNLYGGTEHIATIVRKGLDKEMPEVYKFLDNFNWTLSEIGQVQDWNTEKGADPYENAKKWIRENADKVDAWLK
ncbi:glycine betaine ABC transporter substrate-binding protein [Desulfonema magnum]|uniref:Glycine betaine/proline betaine transport system, substrate-binding protein n=1 Tax=Desulfonema magnum TaxID=45655 RepID=A0A975BK36_9BACT|nr:glycine betaine ABC transporter substrate-binding protein [Desulfonema magnum]QTA86956.1 Glycine betaine/proline betaine transport system, substrate-binding protein [Desulfonema magnum]